ncbi:heptaprenyl diphosphate synthase component 1 [Paenibacillus sp. NPDC058071]|uniref:heptaprenyl diphosphate synthase component 1 n=1 Tax=Paenibacillus sp. NPDC058071 TaxID=3346326 RepID=UPI0036DB22DD
MKPYTIDEIAKKYVEYDMIQLHTELPALSALRLRLLYACLSEESSGEAHSELYTLAVSLVQLGLDTHDLIDVETEARAERDMRSRQLKVLAGDYFSSHYYRLLSHAGQVEMIAKISEAVCEFNRLKMNMYMKMKHFQMTAEDYLRHSVQLKNELFQPFAPLIGGDLQRLWPEMLNGMSKCEAVLDEMERSETPARFRNSWAYWHVMQQATPEERESLQAQEHAPAFVRGLLEKYGTKERLAECLQAAAEEVKAVAGKLQSDKLAEELRYALERSLALAKLAPAERV